MSEGYYQENSIVTNKEHVERLAGPD